MTLADRLANPATAVAPSVNRRRSAPQGFEPGVKFEAGQAAEVTLTVTEIPENETAWREKILEHTEIDVPDHRKVELTAVRYWGDPASPMVYVRFEISDRPEHVEAADVAETLKIIRANRKPSPRKTVTGRTRVVVVSDAQIGKVDERGGTPELLARIDHLLAQVEQESRDVKCDDVIILDPGDLTEGFENTAQQAHTNDLSLPEQLRVARGILTEAVTRISRLHPAGTRVATVPSNHSAWRRGKNYLGKPGDDFGLDVHRAVAEAFAFAGRDDVTFIIPDVWDESLALQVRGAVIGMAHGHQVTRPDGIRDWWAKQTHGGGPLAAASILVTGHFHHLRLEPTGAIEGRDRWWIQAPTLDGGSSWWRNSGGGSSGEPGAVTFTIDDAGDWDNLRLVRAREPHDDAEK